MELHGCTSYTANDITADEGDYDIGRNDDRLVASPQSLNLVEQDSLAVAWKDVIVKSTKAWMVLGVQSEHIKHFASCHDIFRGEQHYGIQ